VPPLLDFQTALTAILKYVPVYFRLQGKLFSEGMDAIWTNIKNLNLLGALDALVRVITQAPFQALIAIPESLYEAMAAKAGHYKRYVITGDKAFELIRQINRKVLMEVGQFGNDTILDMVIERVVGMLWRIITKSGPLRKLLSLMKIKDLDGALRFFKQAYVKTLMYQIVRFSLLWIALSYAMIQAVIIGLFWHQLFPALPQDSKRTQIPRRRGRVNLRTGPDT